MTNYRDKSVLVEVVTLKREYDIVGFSVLLHNLLLQVGEKIHIDLPVPLRDYHVGVQLT